MNQFLNTDIDHIYRPAAMRPHWPAHNLPACSGTCSQGRGKCSTPQVCRVSLEDEDGEPLTRGEAVRVYLSMFGMPAVVILGALVAALWGAA